MLQLTTPATTTKATATPIPETTTGDSDVCTPTLSPVKYLDAESLEELYDQCVATDSYDRLCQAVSDVFSSVDRLGKSFVCRPGQERQHLPSKEINALNKEQRRQLEGEHDKDEDSTQRTDTLLYQEEGQDVVREEGELSEERTADADGEDDDDEDEDEDEPMGPSKQEQLEEFLKKAPR